MPTYCFLCPTCKTRTDRTCAIADRQKMVKCACGRMARRDYLYEHKDMKARGAFCILSDASGINPDQYHSVKAAADKAGVKMPDFTPDGRAIITSHGQKKIWAKFCGLHERNSFY